MPGKLIGPLAAAAGGLVLKKYHAKQYEPVALPKRDRHVS
jgi:hypothetical protein